MDGAMLGIVIAIGVNIAITAFSAGKLYQKVNDLCHRVDSLEKKVNNTDTHLDILTEKLARIEGKLEG